MKVEKITTKIKRRMSAISLNLVKIINNVITTKLDKIARLNITNILG